MERVKKIAFLKIYDVWFDTEKFLEKRMPIKSLHTNDILKTEQYDFKLMSKTFILDISCKEEEIFNKFEYKSCKYAINKAIRDGVIVREVLTNEEREQYLVFQKEFCEKKGIPMLDKEEIEKLRCFYALSKESEYLGACAFIESADKKTVRYKYGATLHKLNANEIILWEVIKEYHNRGYKYFDFGGCIPTEDKESYYYRHYHFKKKFGGDLIDSYIYFRIVGFYRLFYMIFLLMVKVFFKGDINGFTNWLNERKILK